MPRGVANDPDMKKSLRLFDYIKKMTNQKEDLDFRDPHVRKGYKPFVINRVLASSDMLTRIVNDQFNRLHCSNIPPSLHYRTFYYKLPGRYLGLEYPKKAEDTMPYIRYICDFFEVGLRDGRILYQKLSEEQIEAIINDYKYGQNDELIEV
jgi:hypothetical protein